MNFKTFNYKEESSVGYVFISQPPQNRMTLHFFDELELLTKDLSTRKLVGLIISSEGRHFSSGADTDELTSVIGKLDKDRNVFLEKNIKTFKKIESLNCPTIAAVKGCCFGAALELALSCQFIIAAKNSVFSMPESEFGLMPGCGGTIRLTERVGLSKALELILRGRTFSAEEAFSLGVVDKICSKKDIIQVSESLLYKN